jgi:hypothetical protein
MHKVVRTLLWLLFLSPCLLDAQQQGRARIALFEPASAKPDATLSAVLAVVADTVELSLIVLDRWEVTRLPAVDLPRVRAYCAKNRIDQAIAGSASARKEGGYAFRLVVFDRLKDAVTITREASSTGTLDIFDVADELVGSLLDGLSGTHLAFGALAVDSDPPGATIALNGREIGPAPLSLRGLPTGAVRVTARAEARDDAEATVTIADGETASAVLKMARSAGTLAVVGPAGSVVRARNPEVGEKLIGGTATVELPTGPYTLEGSSPGLPPSAGTVTVRRGETARWEPWPKGYLELDTTPPGARILVDGVDRGITPRTVEVEPGAPHAVELALVHYEPTRLSVTAEAATRRVLAETLVGRPGQLRYETSIPGARVKCDDGEWQETPYTFVSLAPGRHSIAIEPLRVGLQYFVAQGNLGVEVKPEEETFVSTTLVPVTSRLAIGDAPPGATATVGGEPADASIFTTGAVVAAGSPQVVVTGAAAGQSWKGSLLVLPGEEKKARVEDLEARLPRRTIRVDGAPDDWAGIWPVWSGEPADRYPDQPGTRLARVFLCRDDTNLYGRMDFADGTPTATLTKDIKGRLLWGLTAQGYSTGPVTVQLGMTRSGREKPWIGMVAGSAAVRPAGQDGAWAVGDSLLEFQVPLALLKLLRGKERHPTDFFAANADPRTRRVDAPFEPKCTIDFSD